MNLRVLVDPKEAEGHPLELFVIGFVYALIGVLIAGWIFPDYASFVMITITVAAVTPLIFHIISHEASRDAADKKEKELLKGHRKAVFVLTLLFLGFVAGYLAGFFLLPPDLADITFVAQADTIVTVQGGFISDSFTGLIIQNNMRILFLCIVLSIFFGTGGILILAWNASVMALALGSVIIEFLIQGSPMIAAVASSMSHYLIHGIPEIMAYVVGGLAGGIIFHAVVRKQWNRVLLKDVGLLLVLATLLIIGSAFIEKFVTPLVI